MTTLDDLENAYAARRAALEPVLRFARASSRYGFPILCGLRLEKEEARLVWAARLLLHTADIELEGKVTDQALTEVIRSADGALKEDVEALLKEARST